MAMHPSVNEELKKVRSQKRALVKREKVLKAEQTLEKDIGKWQKIMDAKSACHKILKDADLGLRMSLAMLEKFPDYYVYQHPVNKKLKTANRNEEWVKHYIGVERSPKGGLSGVEADLIDTARKSRLSAWKRATKRKKKKVLKPLSGKTAAASRRKVKGSGKAKAVGSIGVG